MAIARCLLSVALAVGLLGAGKAYDFRQSAAYTVLSDAERQKLDQVDRDLTLIWGALDRYADENDGAVPETLTSLVSLYLKELPKDPFAGGEKGMDYRYRRGAAGNRAWVISSVGLPEFPYLAEKGNVGLYRCKGVWISGINPTTIAPVEKGAVTRP